MVRELKRERTDTETLVIAHFYSKCPKNPHQKQLTRLDPRERDNNKHKDSNYFMAYRMDVVVEGFSKARCCFR